VSDDERVLAPFGRRACRVTRVESVGPYRVLEVADPGAPLPWPGQFYMLAAVEGWGAGEDERPYLPRAFSFLRADDGRIAFMFEDVGPGTARLARLREGEELWLVGPLGNGFPRPDGPAVLCGGGVGVPPLAALQARLAPDAPALVGFRDAHHAQAARLLAHAQIATDDGSAGRHGLVTELLEERLERDPGVTVYACGPPAMLEAVRALCTRRGVAAQLALESGMACGFGACFGCVVPTKDGYLRVCVDGPVLAADRLESALVAGIGH